MKRPTINIALTVAVLVLSSATFVSSPAVAQSVGIGQLLGGASDKALDKLAQPGAFSADKAVRILLPGALKKADKLLRFTSKAGLTKDITKSMNDAASLAAREAKPIFRNAISDLNLKDSVTIARASNGATQYLRENSTDIMHDKIRPLVRKAMGDTGVFDQLDKLSSASVISKLGISSDKMADHVTKKTLDGIFKYMEAEESKFRQNPIKGLGSLLGIK